MRKLVLHFLSTDSATTSIEYALIAAGISIFVIGAVNWRAVDRKFIWTDLCRTLIEVLLSTKADTGCYRLGETKYH